MAAKEKAHLGSGPIPNAVLGDCEESTTSLRKPQGRRHLNESQRAMVAAKLANMSHGGDRSKPSIEGLSADKASSLLNVGRASVERAKTVHRDGAPELARAVEQGKVSVSAADEYDAAQERGEVAGQGKPSKEEGLPTAEHIGLSRKAIHEARAIRDADGRHA